MSGSTVYAGGNFSVVGGTTPRNRLAAFNPDGTLAAWNPNANGTVTYTANPDFVGTDTFSYKVNDGAADSNVATVTVTVLPAPKFLVVDATADKTFRYQANGGYLSQSSLNLGNKDVRGVAANADGSTAWVIDKNKIVYVYDASMTLLGSWTPGGLNTPTGISVSGTDVWIVDSNKDMAFGMFAAFSIIRFRRNVGQSRDIGFIFLAGVGELMTEVAGEVCDGFICHGFTTERYLREVTIPALERGRAKAGKTMDGFEIVGPSFVVTGNDQHEMNTAADATRQQIAFYGSTPAYSGVLELHGWDDLHGQLNSLSKQGKWVEMGSLITDEILNTFAVVGEPTRLRVVRGCKGCLRFAIHALGRAAHSSKPHEGRSAVVAMAHAILELERHFATRLAQITRPGFGTSTGLG